MWQIFYYLGPIYNLQLLASVVELLCARGSSLYKLPLSFGKGMSLHTFLNANMWAKGIDSVIFKAISSASESAGSP